GLVRGTVVSLEPDKEVVILVPGIAEARRVPWAEVDRVDRGAGAATPPAVAVAGVPLPGLPQPGELGAPPVPIESNQPVSLHDAAVSLDGRVRPVVCRTPCDAVVDGRAGRAFYFAGDEVPESSRFLLTEKSGDVTVKVSTGNTALEPAGNVFVTLGVLS